MGVATFQYNFICTNRWDVTCGPKQAEVGEGSVNGPVTCAAILSHCFSDADGFPQKPSFWRLIYLANCVSSLSLSMHL